MKIISLEAENVKHLRVVQIKPDGSLVVVGGDNAAGKSCVLDSIEYALGGADSIPSEPIRKGQKRARVVLDLGDIIVTRTFTGKGTNLTVKNKDGATFKSPQTMLTELVGELAFDPLEFSKMGTKRQAEVLKQLVGIDFDQKNADRKKLFDERTEVNRDGKDLRSRVDGTKHHDDVPDSLISLKQLTVEHEKAYRNNATVSAAKMSLSNDEKELEKLEQQVKILRRKISDQRKELSSVEVMDIKAISLMMEEAEAINNKVRENEEYDKLSKQLTELRSKSQKLTNQIEMIDEDKEKVLANAKFPVDGLAIDDDGVTFKDIPFDQCASAEQIRVSVAIGLAMNPKLRILLIREGSLLDKNNLATIAGMAEKADAQVWIERVSEGSECTVIMEDGSVRE